MPADPDCVFCQIVAGKIPAGIIYEDESCVAFLDINPLAEGHLLMVSREHYAGPVDMSPEVCGSLFAAVPKLARTLVEVTKAEGFNVLLNSGRVSGQVVMHAHVHLIPRKSGDRLGYRWNAGRYPPGRDQELAQAYRQALAAQR